jgi:hypothetical protein
MRILDAAGPRPHHDAMSTLAARIREFFVKLTDREPAEVELPAEVRHQRPASKGLLYARLDQPPTPKGRRVKLPSAKDIVTAAFYGPDDERASKLVIAVPGSRQEPHRWMSVDVLEDSTVLAEARAALAGLRATCITVTAGTIGCPHEEGDDFRDGGECSVCPAWRGRQGSVVDAEYAKAQALLEIAEQRGPTSVTGRNNPCPCGSGKKYKKCCGK